MSEHSPIEWTHHTFNPWWGCTKVSPACDHCYAQRDAKRFAPDRELWGADADRRTFGDKHWWEPMKWNARAAKAGVRERVFCASMADVFDKDAPVGARDRLWQLIADTPSLDWLLLTKRIGNAARMMPAAWLDTGGAPNVRLGATIVNREEMLRDATKLKATPARVRFWSVEPMLGDLGVIPPDLMPDWVIAGGESGPHARPARPDWFRSLRDQCAAAGVPFLFKQWGEWGPARDADVIDRGEGTGGTLTLSGRIVIGPGTLQRVGKKAAGRLLDGVQHDGFPA